MRIILAKQKMTGPHSAVGNVSGNRCESDINILNFDQSFKRGCRFKIYFLSRALAAISLCKGEPFGNFGRRHYEEHFEFEPVVQDEICFKIFLIYSSSGHLVRRSGPLGNFVREHYDKHFREIILNSDKWFMFFKFQVYYILLYFLRFTITNNMRCMYNISNISVWR